jgi:hypothetical protein
VLISTINSIFLSLSSLSSKRISGFSIDIEALTEEDRWLLPPSCFFGLHLHDAFDAPSSRHVVRRCV